MGLVMPVCYTYTPDVQAYLYKCICQHMLTELENSKLVLFCSISAKISFYIFYLIVCVCVWGGGGHWHKERDVVVQFSVIAKENRYVVK